CIPRTSSIFWICAAIAHSASCSPRGLVAPQNSCRNNPVYHYDCVLVPIGRSADCRRRRGGGTGNLACFARKIEAKSLGGRNHCNNPSLGIFGTNASK